MHDNVDDAVGNEFVCDNVHGAPVACRLSAVIRIFRSRAILDRLPGRTGRMQNPVHQIQPIDEIRRRLR